MKNKVFFFILIALTSCADQHSVKTGLEGKPIPSFKLLLSDSVSYFDTKEITAGKPTVFFYFSPYCPYCKAQMEEITKRIEILKDIQFCIFTAGSFMDMKRFYSHFQLNKYPNILAGIDQNYFFGNYFKPKGVPYIVIYGKDKILREAFIGNIEGNTIKKVAEH